MKRGIHAAVLIPMHKDYSCNIEELVRHSKDLLKRGCSGIVLFGTTGEGSSFSVQERIDILNGVIQGGIDPQQIILANASANIPDTQALILAGCKANIAAHLIAPPGLYKNISEEGVIAYYRELICPNVKILLYHIPQLTGVPITCNIIKQLTSAYPDAIVGIKESEGNIEYAKQILQQFSHLQLFVGRELDIIEAMRYGAAGSICGLANLFPELITSLLDASENPLELIQAIEAQKNRNFIACMKQLMQKKYGSAWNTLRPPLMPLF